MTHFHLPKMPNSKTNERLLPCKTCFHSRRESDPSFPQVEAKADLISLCHKAAHVNKQSVSRYACCHKVVI